jgi:exodeoxyribonuclease III
VYVYNIHFPDFPYQPYQLFNLMLGPAPFLQTEKEAIEAAKQAKGPALEILFEDLKESQNAIASFIFGDFNEP